MDKMLDKMLMEGQGGGREGVDVCGGSELRSRACMTELGGVVSVG